MKLFTKIIHLVLDRIVWLEVRVLEKFVELYKGFGIECNIVCNDTNDDKEIYLSGTKEYPEKYATYSDKFNGYLDFYSQVTFDGDGKFIGQDFYEWNLN